MICTASKTWHESCDKMGGSCRGVWVVLFSYDSIVVYFCEIPSCASGGELKGLDSSRRAMVDSASSK